MQKQILTPGKKAIISVLLVPRRYKKIIKYYRYLSFPNATPQTQVLPSHSGEALNEDNTHFGPGSEHRIESAESAIFQEGQKLNFN